VSNSVKFTNRKGKIKIIVDLKGREKKTLKLSVIDNGLGIKESE
jgi:signal transduction histidine kinase